MKAIMRVVLWSMKICSLVSIGLLASECPLRAVTPLCEVFPPSEMTKEPSLLEIAGPVCGIIRSHNESNKVIVALGFDEGALTGLIVRQDLLKRVKKNVHVLLALRAAAVHGSLAHYVLDRCARKLVGQSLAHEEFVFRHIEMKSRFRGNDIDVISGFGPQMYKFANSKAPDMLCSGATLAENLPQWVLVGRDELSNGRDEIAHRVAELLGHQSWQRSHAQEFIDLMRKRLAEAGITLSEEQLVWLNKSTRSLSLKDQLSLFSRDQITQQAPVDTIFNNIRDFAKQTKQVSASAEAKDKTDSSVLELIDRTPDLKAIATKYDQ